MKAAFLVGPRQLELRDLPDPVAPKDGLVLQVRACGVCGSDIRRWREGPAGAGDIVPGHEVAGVVTQVGADVRGYRVGDHLALAPDIHCGTCYYCQRGLYNLCDDLHMVGITPGYYGGFAEQMVLSGEVLTNGIVHRMPAGLSFRDGALAEPCSSVLAAHEKTGTGLDDTVVVVGAGPIGCLHIAIARARGARVVVSQRSATRRTLAQAFGPDEVIDPGAEEVVARVRELTEGRGADVIIVANGACEVPAQAVQMARKGGWVVLFGGLPKANPMVCLDANRIHYGEIHLIGAFSYHPTMHALALDVLARGLVPTNKLVSHTFPLEQIAEAFEAATDGGSLKVMITANA